MQITIPDNYAAAIQDNVNLAIAANEALTTVNEMLYDELGIAIEITPDLAQQITELIAPLAKRFDEKARTLWGVIPHLVLHDNYVVRIRQEFNRRCTDVENNMIEHVDIVYRGAVKNISMEYFRLHIAYLKNTAPNWGLKSPNFNFGNTYAMNLWATKPDIFWQSRYNKMIDDAFINFENDKEI